MVSYVRACTYAMIGLGLLSLASVGISTLGNRSTKNLLEVNNPTAARAISIEEKADLLREPYLSDLIDHDYKTKLLMDPDLKIKLLMDPDLRDLLNHPDLGHTYRELVSKPGVAEAIEAYKNSLHPYKWASLAGVVLLYTALMPATLALYEQSQKEDSILH